VDEAADLVESILDMTGWTQPRLVHEIKGVARSLHEPEPTGLQPITVNRWKRRRQRPSRYYQRLLRILHAAVCGEPIAVWARRDGEGDDMKRRQFIGYVTALAGCVALDPERVSAGLQRGAGIDSGLVESLAASISGHARRWHVTRPDELLPSVKRTLRTANELRIASRASRVRVRLTSLTSEAAALAGWLAWQTGNDEAADAYHTFADGLAAEAGDQDGRAFVLVLRSFGSSGLFRPAVGADDQRRALTMLDEAVALTERSMSPFLRVFALVRRAEELARAGEAAETERHLDRAHAALTSVAGPHDGFFSYWSEDRLRGARGTCAMALGQGREAIALLSGMASTTPAELTAERSILLTDLGAAHAMLDEVEHACDLLSQSLELGAAGHAERVGRVQAIRSTHLARWSETPAVRRFDETVRAAVSGLGGASAGFRPA
jgi:hypothetical protein